MNKFIFLLLILTMFTTTVPVNATTITHSEASSLALERGLTCTNGDSGYLCYADNYELVEPDSEDLYPFEEFYYIDDPTITKEYVGIVYDYKAALELHNKYCSCMQKHKLCKKHKKCKKCKKLHHTCKKHRKCKKCR